MRLISKLTVAAILFGSISAQAEAVRCSFTEPFIQVTVDAAAKTVTYLDAIENKTTVHAILENTQQDGVTRIVWGPGEEENTVLEFHRDPSGGSDGMSDFLFPYTGEMWTGDTDRLVGGCDTESEPAVNPYEAPFPGCYEVLVDIFEDGASLYSAIGQKIVGPLTADPKTKSLGLFLESALITKGYMGLSLDVCRSIDEAVK